MERHAQKISVIIPVFNNERYLPRCCDSVLGQTYKDIEVVLVDDGSTDGTPTLCDRYAAQDARVKVVHQSNGGEGAARNAGLAAASGDWIMWVDSDDWIEERWIEYFADQLHRHPDADVVITGTGVGVWRHPEPLRQFLMDRIVHTMWTSCTRRGLYDGLTFTDQKIGADVLMQIQVVWKAATVAVIPRSSGYHYEDNEQSVTRVGSIRTRLGWPKRADLELAFVRNVAPQMLNCARFDVMRGAGVIIESVRKLDVPPEEHAQKRALLKRLRGYVWNGLFHLPLRSMRRKEYATALGSLRKALR
ncbi:glycosyltransferase [Bifidobacterium anseris]|uniref:Glycosyltransferase n=2 Tax=Bifidobacterium anseris TaxID=2020963 RepID=A0A2N5IZS4_9BIFI|nr:glycosyltransferase family A protein [Bifidobacterium anseris]PLS27456.1 glycosyltransferase [Bifidobacterium anseris]